MSNKQINYYISYLVLIVLCIPTIALPGWLASVLTMGKLLGFAWSLLLFWRLSFYRKKRLFLFWVFLCTAVISTILNRTSIRSLFDFVYPIFTSCIIVYYLVGTAGNKIINKTAIITSALLVVQGVSALKGGIAYVRDGNGLLNLHYFFGQRVAINNILIFGLSLAMLALLNASATERVIHWAAMGAGIWFVRYESVSTGLMSILLFFMIVVGSKVVRSERVWRNLGLAILGFSAVFVFSGGLTNGFEWLLIDFLGEGMTLNGRTVLWNDALEKMNGWHWLVGNGCGHLHQFSIDNWHVGTAHSQYMNLLFEFGIIGVLVYFAMLVQMFLATRKVKDKNIRSILLASIITIIITGIPTTLYKHIYIFVFFIIADCIDIIYVDEWNSQQMKTNILKLPKFKKIKFCFGNRKAR